MNNQEILKTVEKEYSVYKANMMRAGADEIWEYSATVTAWRYIKDFLEGNADSGDDLLAELYSKAGDGILSTLTKYYMNNEGYDIGNWDEIRSLALDYLKCSK